MYESGEPFVFWTFNTVSDISNKSSTVCKNLIR